jgi:glycosyltransferase involved in cell wall biosynthesis
MGAFPTRKAYGVTTLKTLECFTKKGIQGTCISFPGQPGATFTEEATPAQLMNFAVNKKSLALRKFSKSKNSYFSIISWKAYCKLSIRDSKRRILDLNPSILWMRDTTLMDIEPIRNSRQLLVVELHQIPGRKLVKRIQKFPADKILLAPISISIMDYLERLNLNNHVIYSPMGVDPEMFKPIDTNGCPTRFNSQTKPIRIGYFGKLKPGGYSKGYQDLIKLGNLHQAIEFNSELLFVGGLDYELKNFQLEIEESGILKSRTTIIPHLPQAKAIELMYTCDFLVLPKPESKDYSGFPLKALEYAATGVRILAASSKVNHDVFGEKFQPFWYDSGDAQSMHLALLDGMNAPSDIGDTVRSQEFAFSHSWEARTSSILSQLNTLSPQATLS